jgi:hypothetical protein
MAPAPRDKGVDGRLGVGVVLLARTGQKTVRAGRVAQRATCSRR